MTPAKLISPDDIKAALARIPDHDDRNLLTAYFQQLLNQIARLQEHLEMEREDD